MTMKTKSLHQSLEAKLASIKDPEHSESDGDEGPEKTQAEGISAKRAGKVANRKGRTNKDDAAASNQPSTVVYLGHLPAGFEEREITVFLNQFGNVKRCRVSRSPKTGRSRGYAFVDFADADVTKIVAETMSGYFLMEKRLVCHILPHDKVHDLTFAKPRRVPSKADQQKKARAEVNKHRPADVLKGITAKLVQREEMKRKKLATLGIEYEFPGYAGVVPAGVVPSVPEVESKSSKKKKKKRKMSEGEEKEDEKNADEATTPKSRKVSEGEEEVDKNNADSAKTPKSQKKRRKKAKKGSSVEESADGKKHDATTDDTNEVTAATAAIAESSKKKKKKNSKTKTPKKAQTPKNK